MIPSSPIVPRQTVNSNSVAAQQMFWVLSFRQKPCPCRNNRRAWHTWKWFDEACLHSFISAIIQIRRENVKHLSRLFLKNHSCFLDLYPIGFAGKVKLVGRWQHFDLLPWCELPVEVDTLLDERRVDADQVQNGRGQSILLCDVSEQQKYVVCTWLSMKNCQGEVNPIEIFVPLDYCALPFFKLNSSSKWKGHCHQL